MNTMSSIAEVPEVSKDVAQGVTEPQGKVQDISDRTQGTEGKVCAGWEAYDMAPINICFWYPSYGKSLHLNVDVVTCCLTDNGRRMACHLLPVYKDCGLFQEFLFFIGL